MTLKEWQAENPQYWSKVVGVRNVPRNCCWYVHATVVALWHLTDYVVSSVSGQGVFMVQR